MAKTDYKTIDQYHQSFEGEVLDRMKSIRRLIHETVPEVQETISYQIPCFKYHGYLIYYCAFAKHITLSNPFSEAFLEHFREELKGFKVSRAAIQLPHNQPLPEALIRRIISFRRRENEERQALAGSASK